MNGDRAIYIRFSWRRAMSGGDDTPHSVHITAKSQHDTVCELRLVETIDLAAIANGSERDNIVEIPVS